MSKDKRKNINTTLDEDLWYELKLISWKMSKYKRQIYVNDLVEEGMRYIINKYNSYLPEGYKNKGE